MDAVAGHSLEAFGRDGVQAGEEAEARPKPVAPTQQLHQPPEVGRPHVEHGVVHAPEGVVVDRSQAIALGDDPLGAVGADVTTPERALVTEAAAEGATPGGDGGHLHSAAEGVG